MEKNVSFFKRVTLLLALLGVVGQAWGEGNKVTVTVKTNDSGKGKVYASTLYYGDNSPSEDSPEGNYNESYVRESTGASSGNNRKAKIYAKTEDDNLYKFDGWTILSGGGSFANASSQNTTYTSEDPSSDITAVIQANFSYKSIIRVTASPDPANSGKVYVRDNNSTDPGTGSYQSTHTAKYVNSSGATGTRRFYLFTAATNSNVATFNNWTTDKGTLTNATTAKGAYIDIDLPTGLTEATVKANYTTYSRVAIESYPSDGCYLWVTEGTTVTEDYVRSQKLSSDNSRRTKNADFVVYASPNTGYEFQGWATAKDYSTIVSSIARLGGTIHANLLEDKKYYALLKPYWQFSAHAVATLNGTTSEEGGTVSVSVATAKYVGSPTEVRATTTATFDATPKTGYGFAGWTRTLGKTTPDEGLMAKHLTQTITNEVKGTTLDLTLYAIFSKLSNPTAINVPTSPVVINKSGSKTIAVTLVPASSYHNITYSVSDASVITLTDNGWDDNANQSTATITGLKPGTTTVTVKAHDKDGNELSALTKTVTIKVMDKIPSPIVNLDPSASDNYDKAVVSITAGSGSPSGVIFRYTTNGSDPTETSESYTEPFKISNLQTVKVRAYCTDWYESDIVTQMYTKRITSTPTIEVKQSGSDYVVSFTCKDNDVVFYYTKDGSTPTYDKTTGDATGITTKWNGSAFNPGIAEGTIKVIATHAEWRDSDPVSKNYVRASGVSDGVVYLNDYEDHLWTYYAGVDTKVDGGNYDTNYAGKLYSGVNINNGGKLYSPNPRNVKIIYTANGGAVSISESETTFVYYITLEQGTTSGEYPYQVISNPFSKRPSGKGFGGWKIKSGGDYIKGKSTGNTLALDEEITFENLPYPSVNCTSATIELEATWVTANIVNYSSTTISFSGGTYETNIVVLNKSVSSSLTVSSPCTITMIGSDGTDYRGSYTFSGSITPDNSGVTKIEFVNWQNTSRVDCKGKSLTVGRGMTYGSSKCGDRVYGLYSSGDVNQVIKLESGKFSSFYHYDASVSNFTKQIVIFGCDYDRAQVGPVGKYTNGAAYKSAAYNQKLIITDLCKISSSTTLGFSDTKLVMARTISKSGDIMSSVDVGEAATANVYYYSPDGSSTNYKGGCRYLEIQGGTWCCIAGGLDSYHSADDPAFTFRMRGGLIRGSLYGGGEYLPASGNRTYVLTGGKIMGWLAGGANGRSTSGGGVTTGTSYIYVGGRARIDSEGSTTTIARGLGGNVFGAGCGYQQSDDDNRGQMVNGTNVVVADECYVERGVYGGGVYGFTTATTNLYMTGGRVEGKSGGTSGTSYDANIKGGIFGGACNKKGGTVNIYMTGGTVETGIYGGCNNSGALSGTVKMVIAGGQIGTKTNLTAIACGGGYGSSTTVPSVAMTLGVVGTTTSPYFYGNCYGGSALGTVTGNVSMTINKGGSYSGGSDAGGEIYCGGLGQSGNTSYGNVGGSLTTVINGTDSRPAEGEYAYNAVYGGSHYINQAKTPTVTVNGCEVSIKELYGGSKLATLSGTDITVKGGNTIGSLYGGSNAANINGNVNLKVYGGGIDRVFGGNNNSGSISGTINMSIDQNSTCDMYLGEVYGGGNKAASNSVAINIGCPGYIGQLYGGANEANITGNIVLNVHGGTYGTIYGGNNKSGTISGSVTVNASKTGTCDLNIGTIFGGGNIADLAQSANKVTVNVSGDATRVGNIYGGGNLASVYSTQVNVQGGQISGNIFGGGKGEKGSTKNMILSGGTNVNISGGTLTNVFGGNDAGGTITGTLNTTINKNTALDITGDVYGGGNEASSASGNLEISCVDHIGSVYGGAKNADITGNIALMIKSGRIDNVFGGNNIGGNISGTITIDVQHKDCNTIQIGNLYGGGNLADYSAPAGSLDYPVINLNTCGKSTVDWVNSGNSKLHCMKVGNIFGGGKGEAGNDKGKVTGNPHINIYAGEIGTIFGGGNVADVKGDTYVLILDQSKTDKQDIYVTGNVYGGGNEAGVTGNTHVQIGPKKNK